MSFTRSGSRVLDSLERRFGGLAIHGLLRWIGGFQLLVWLLMRAVPEYSLWIDYHPAKIFDGEVWRLFSFVFFPRTNSFLLIIIAVMFLWFISDSLENAWGTFRLNVYVIATVIFLSLASLNPLLAHYGDLQLSNGDVVKVWAYSGILNVIFYSAVFLAFASEFPEQSILLFFIIPIKVKWLGIANGVLLLVMIWSGFTWLIAIPGMLPFLLVFAPRFFGEVQNRSSAAVRRQKFKAKVEESEDDAFHTCASCGITDAKDPEMEFRVTADGEEYCADCLAAAASQKKSGAQ
ncbi:MAG: hypothetical protein KDN19_02975 [Verrucomicrobiae bacterium]|nr:hypothetical protein [Verrucomicrobiae bacterium]